MIIGHIMRLLEPANAVQIWVGLGNHLIIGTRPPAKIAQNT